MQMQHQLSSRKQPWNPLLLVKKHMTSDLHQNGIAFFKNYLPHVPVWNSGLDDLGTSFWLCFF